MERVFVGIRLNTIAEAVLALRGAPSSADDIFASVGRAARWIPDNNLHMTLRFIGDVTPEKLEEIKSKLATVAVPSFSLSLNGVGVIPKRGPPRVLHCNGVETEGLLDSLQNQVGLALEDIGFPAEKSFLPHVTIARLQKVDRALTKLWTERHQDFACADQRIQDFVLFRSKLLPTGAVYEEIQLYPLT